MATYTVTTSRYCENCGNEHTMTVKGFGAAWACTAVIPKLDNDGGNIKCSTCGHVTHYKPIKRAKEISFLKAFCIALGVFIGLPVAAIAIIHLIVLCIIVIFS